jgi:hypothetical protein
MRPPRGEVLRWRVAELRSAMDGAGPMQHSTWIDAFLKAGYPTAQGRLGPCVTDDPASWDTAATWLEMMMARTHPTELAQFS